MGTSVWMDCVVHDNDLLHHYRLMYSLSVLFSLKCNPRARFHKKISNWDFPQVFNFKQFDWPKFELRKDLRQISIWDVIWNRPPTSKGFVNDILCLSNHQVKWNEIGNNNLTGMKIVSSKPPVVLQWTTRKPRTTGQAAADPKTHYIVYTVNTTYSSNIKVIWKKKTLI